MKDEEAERIMDGAVPFIKRMDIEIQRARPNAFVYRDDLDRICIIIDGMWLGTAVENIQGDQAPFCG